MKNLLRDIKRHCDENRRDFNTVLKNTYILGPIYSRIGILSQKGVNNTPRHSRIE